MSDAVELRLGLAAHQAGHLDQAITRYRKVLRGGPGNTDALYLLGMALLNAGQAGSAARVLDWSAVARPSAAPIHLGLGNARRDAGDLEGARRAFDSAIRLAPSDPDAYNELGLLLRAMGSPEVALRKFEEGLAARAGHVGLAYNRAMTLQTAGRLEAALDGYNDVLARQPDLLDAMNNRAKALHELGRHDDALAGYRALLSVAPEHSAGWNNLGVLWRDRDRAELALTSFVRALCIDPEQGGLHNNLGTVAWSLGQDGRAIAAYEKAWSLAPDLADAALNLGFALTGQGRYRDAVETYRTAAKHHPGDPRFPIRQALALPAVCESVDEIVGLRAGLEAFLDSEQARTLRFEDPISAVGSANFFRVYHGMDDRPPAERIAAFHRRCCLRLSWSAPHCNGARRRLATRPRLGICSKYLSRHTIGLLFAGVIERLAASGQFEIVILRPPGRHDEISKRIDAAADHVVHLPGNLVGAQEAIAEARLDVLLYTDIGMEPMTYFLAFARLAPIQLVTWGHPVTTGLKSLDGYLSADTFEPVDGESHYTEGLRRLGHILMHYEPPAVPAVATKQDFGLSAAAPVYVCPQNVFKLHPDFDGWLADLLRADPTGQVVLIEGVKAGWTNRLRERLSRVMPDVLNRVIFLPYLPTQRYFELVAAADVILDPIHFGGGNTTFHALGLGTPLVTTPGAFQRSRFASGTFRTIGLDHLIARDRRDYIERAVALGQDKGLRARTSKEIRDAAGSIQRRDEPADELQALLLEAVETHQ